MELIKYRYGYNGNQFQTTNQENFIKLISKMNNNIYEFTGDENEECNIYFDIEKQSCEDEEELLKEEKKIIRFIKKQMNIINNDEYLFYKATAHRNNKFSLRLFCYTHKTKKNILKNFVEYLNNLHYLNYEIDKSVY